MFRNPAAEYENSEFVTWIIFGLMRWMPYSLADRARIILMKLPQYVKVKQE
jgi:hypothetical protein